MCANHAKDRVVDMKTRMPLPKPGARMMVGGLVESAISYGVSELSRSHDGVTLIVAPDVHVAETLYREMSDYLATTGIAVQRFADWETLPYDRFSPHQDITSLRLAVLSQLPSMTTGVVIVAVRTLMLPVPAKSYLVAESLSVRVGDKLDLITKRQALEQAGYNAVNQVIARGEFALRGAILDVFPMGAKMPVRIELFDDEIDSIRLFDPEDQCSTEQVAEFLLLPAREYPLTQKAKQVFEDNWDLAFDSPGLSPMLNDLLSGHPPPGIDYYLPLFFDQAHDLFDFLPSSCMVITVGGVRDAATQFVKEVEARYQALRADIERPILKPEQLIMNVDRMMTRIAMSPQINIDSIQRAEHDMGVSALPNVRDDAEDSVRLVAFMATKKVSTRVLFCAHSLGRQVQFADKLTALGIQSERFDSVDDFLASVAPVGMVVSSVTQGFCVEDDWVLITESDLATVPIRQERRQKTSTNPLQAVIKDLSALSIGDAVVHLEHGVGRYLGIQTIETQGLSADYITIQYLGEDKLYVPITALNLVSRYSGVDNKNPPLYALGKGAWKKAKEKALKRIRDVAAELLEVYAKRAEKTGIAMPVEDGYPMFASEFPFEETADQAAAIEAVLADLAQAKPMDRLLCGDVGFGKTEVAMRAAFVAVQNGKQVAILVPTTLLAKQHLINFQDRFAKWPIQVGMLSRFNTPKEQKTALDKLKAGQLDIVIGTHKLLSKTVVFHDLGLLVVDEEHRFGVTQKEKIKAMRTNVDILTMSATPIPRTLNMAMSAMRDLSIIATPPLKRRNVETFMYEYSKTWIVEAITREIARGGQVYFLHNDVSSILKVQQDLQHWLPELKIAIGHAQMSERQLESVMAGFYHHRYQVLICSTIIESGIDIPNANTIIINKANTFGLGQLHQLRGRVGRSHHQAYAYLLVPNKDGLTRDAKRRLDAFKRADSLGAGFILASHDLEIRGAGELLGAEQSGQLQRIGFNLYMELLQAVTTAMHEDRSVEIDDNLLARTIDVDLSMSTIIPDTYLGDVNMRLGFYKRISSAGNQKSLTKIEVELIDRFGLLPAPTKQLFEVSALMLQAKALGLNAILATDKRITLTFDEHPNIDFDTVINLVRTSPKQYQFAGSTTLVYMADLADPKTRIDETKRLLSSFHSGGGRVV